MNDPQKYTENKMQEIARYVKSQLPQKWGFVVLAFPFSNAKGRMNYVSNTQREDVVAAMREFIAETENSWGEHK